MEHRRYLYRREGCIYSIDGINLDQIMEHIYGRKGFILDREKEMYLGVRENISKMKRRIYIWEMRKSISGRSCDIVGDIGI